MGLLFLVIGVVLTFLVCLVHRKRLREKEKQADEAWQNTTAAMWRKAVKARKEWEKKNVLRSFTDPEYQELIRWEAGAFMMLLDAHPKLSYGTVGETNKLYLDQLIADINEHETFS